MRIKVYHVKTDDYGRIISPQIIPHGYIKADTFNAEECFNLCNWFHWCKEKPKNVHSDIDSCNHGLILYNPQTKEYWLALSKGWHHGNAKKIKAYIDRNWQKFFWNESEIDEPPHIEAIREI